MVNSDPIASERRRALTRVMQMAMLLGGILGVLFWLNYQKIDIALLAAGVGAVMGAIVALMYLYGGSAEG